MNIRSIIFIETEKQEDNSLFPSRLIVDWREPLGNCQLNISDTWSLGCVHEAAGVAPYTNLIKGNDTILVNTCFYWGAGEQAGQRVAFLVIE